MIKIQNYTFDELSVTFVDPQIIIRIPATVPFDDLENALHEANNTFVYNDKTYSEYEKLISIAKEPTTIEDIDYIYVIILETTSDPSSVIVGTRITIETAHEIRDAIEHMVQNVPDESAEEYIWAFPEWKNETAYKVKDRVVYLGYLYACLQAHTSQADWTPDVAASLWAKVINVTPTGEIPVWTQPTSTNPYMKGDKVYYPTENDAIYESTIDNNVWSPRDYPQGWKVVE